MGNAGSHRRPTKAELDAAQAKADAMKSRRLVGIARTPTPRQAREIARRDSDREVLVRSQHALERIASSLEFLGIKADKIANALGPTLEAGASEPPLQLAFNLQESLAEHRATLAELRGLKGAVTELLDALDRDPSVTIHEPAITRYKTLRVLVST